MKNRLIVLNYHQVPERLDELRPASISRTIFRQQLRVLAKYFNVLALDHAFNLLRENKLPSRALAITFDDGYRDNFDVALPELKKANLPATFFIATDYIDGGCMWNDKIAESIRLTTLKKLDLDEFGLGLVPISSTENKISALKLIIQNFKYLSYEHRMDAVDKLVEQSEVELPTNLMMTSTQIRELDDAGMIIGGHTASHPILKNLTVEQAQEDIELGRDFLSALIDQPLKFFAYPNGKANQDYDKGHAELLAHLGFDAAFSTQWGYVDRDTPRFELPRVGFAQAVGWKLAIKAGKSYFDKASNFAT